MVRSSSLSGLRRQLDEAREGDRGVGGVCCHRFRLAVLPEDVFPRLRWGRRHRHGALASHTDVCEKVEVTFLVEKGHVVCGTVLSEPFPLRGFPKKPS